MQRESPTDASKRCTSMGIDAIPGMDVFPKESVIRRLQVPGFTLYDLRYGDNLYISPRHHAMAHITCLLQGSFKMFYAEMYRTYREGAVLFHPIGQTNAQQFASEASRVLCIQLTEVMMKRLFSAFSSTCRPSP